MEHDDELLHFEKPGYHPPEDRRQARDKKVERHVHRKKVKAMSESPIQPFFRHEQLRRHTSQPCKSSCQDNNDDSLESDASDYAVSDHFKVAGADEVANDRPAKTGHAHAQVVDLLLVYIMRRFGRKC